MVFFKFGTLYICFSREYDALLVLLSRSKWAVEVGCRVWTLVLQRARFGGGGSYSNLTLTIALDARFVGKWETAILIVVVECEGLDL